MSASSWRAPAARSRTSWTTCSPWDGPSAAASFLDAFEAFLREVGENPSLHAFSRLPEIAALGYRSAVVGRYVALYFERNGRVYVAHVFHQGATTRGSFSFERRPARTQRAPALCRGPFVVEAFVRQLAFKPKARGKAPRGALRGPHVRARGLKARGFRMRAVAALGRLLLERLGLERDGHLGHLGAGDVALGVQHLAEPPKPSFLTAQATGSLPSRRRRRRPRTWPGSGRPRRPPGRRPGRWRRRSAAS